ncbi:MAG: hypothetical protein OEV30_12955 [Ignavibacteria bacterium]|nr:hypothetical protein [Ignavibacteria bacterium]
MAGILITPASSQELPFAHYTVEKEVNPLPSSAVMMTHQDRAGYIWFVVYSSGLVQYDGRKQVLYDLENGLPSVDVRELIEDPSGRLWVATEAGLAVTTKGMGEYGIGESIVFTDSLGSVPLISSSVIENRVCVDKAGVVWTGTRNLGIIRYSIDGGQNLLSDTISTSGSSGGNLDVRALTVRNNGTVWASLSGG